MYKYGKNFKKPKKVRISDSENQRINDVIRIPVQVIKEARVPEADRSTHRFLNEEQPKSRNPIKESSEKMERQDHARRRSNRGKSYFNPLLGDNFVDRKSTRTLVYYRPPFDWYNSDRCEILDEYEEILVPDKSVYSRQSSDDSIYDRLDRYDYHQDHERERHRRRKDPYFDSELNRKKKNGVIKKEVVREREYKVEEEENLFSFSDPEKKSPIRKIDRLKKNRENDLNDVVENFNEITIDERKKYRKPPKRY
ncbi:hypothetical protein BpHYR1_027358 [Brachionus plicatilis]|uniref:Uncharacterized protein n=1 Tax=Brachionus plicatilis TaxID=10195 RepID=A0A3M7QNU1_BRAPC|nr:hypothetical protein BpHYR1_027358 [Brachionus plicatilis]